MSVSFEDVYLGMELALLAFMPVAMTIMVYFLNKHAKRNHVWLFLHRKNSTKLLKKFKPQKGMLVTRWGAYQINPDAAGIYKGRPFYEFFENYPYPFMITRDRIPVDIETEVEVEKDGKKVKQKKTHMEYQEIVRQLPIAPSSDRISSYIKDRTHAQVYGGAASLQILLIIVAVLVVIGIVISVAK